MERIDISSKIMELIKEEDVFLLIKKLEAKGNPIQVKIKIEVDTPDSLRYDKTHQEGMILKYFGNFSERPVTVTRVQNLEPKYEHDILLLEGEYPTLTELKNKIDDYNAFYTYIKKGHVSEKACNIIKEKFKGHNLIQPLSSCLYIQDNGHEVYSGGRRIDIEWPKFDEVSKLLDSKGLLHLQHNIIAIPDRLYDDRTDFDGIHPAFVDETKIADISFKLL